MSADNFLYVDKLGDGRYGVFDCSASADDPLYRNRPISKHATAEQAIRAAHKADREGYYEYGVSVAPSVMSEWDES